MGNLQLYTKTITDILAGTVGRVTAALGTVVGALTSVVLIMVLGIFLAIEPRLYERGVAWLLPMNAREAFSIPTAPLCFTLPLLFSRRLLGFAFSSVFSFLPFLSFLLPLSALFCLLPSLLSFLPTFSSLFSFFLFFP